MIDGLGAGDAASVAPVLARVAELQREGVEVLVAGSLSYVPLMPDGRLPRDVDLLVEEADAKRVGARFAIAHRRWPVPGVPEFLRPRIRVGALRTGGEQADCLLYARRGESVRFRLGGGLSIVAPVPDLEHAPELRWEGVAYRALPAEMTFLSKGLMHAVKARVGQSRGERKHVLDMRRLARAGHWEDVRMSLYALDLRWLGVPVPFRLWTGRSRADLLGRLRDLWDGRIDPPEVE